MLHSVGVKDNPNPSVKAVVAVFGNREANEAERILDFLTLSDPDRLTTATLEAVERRSVAVLSQKALCKSVDKMLLKV